MDKQNLQQCRFCADLKESEKLFDINSIDLVSFEQEIEAFFSISFSDETFSKVICNDCCNQVHDAFQFREKVIKAQKLLVPSRSDQRFSGDDELNDSGHFDDCVANSDLNSDDDYSFPDKHDYNSEDAKEVKTSASEIAIDHQTEQVQKKSRRTKTTTIKRKYIRTGKLQRKKELLQDPERAKLSAERAELIKRVSDEWRQYKWKCALCEFETQNGVEILNEHYSLVHKEPAQYTCMECRKTFRSYSYFKRHVGAHRNKFKYKCDICIRFFSRSKDFRNHAETHSSEHKYMCPHCGKHYKAAMSYKAHLRKHKEISNPKNIIFECELCHKHLKSKHSLYCHKKMHIGKREFTCEQCGKTFLFLSGLKVHIQVRHSDAKPYACAICQKMFKSRSLLSMHQQVHKVERKYGCDVCGKRFHRGETLKRHSSVHTGILAFPCESCTKRFRTNQQLRVHLRQHTGERPYACDSCNHRFVDSSNYIKHMRAKHGLMTIRKNVQYKSEEPVTNSNEYEK